MLKNEDSNDAFVVQAAALDPKAWEKMMGGDTGSHSEMSEAEETLSMYREWRLDIESRTIFDNLKNYKGHHDVQLDPAALNNRNKLEEQLKALIKLENENSGDISEAAKLRREKIQTLERMTHFQESKEILALINENIKNRAAKNNLEKSLRGSEGGLGGLVKQSLAGESSELRDFLEKQVDAEKRTELFKKPKIIDSVAFGQEGRWGDHNYIPPSKLETRLEHR